MQGETVVLLSRTPTCVSRAETVDTEEEPLAADEATEGVRMEHLGDITKISGKDAPVVNVIIGGSPCQDLSIAGKRAGLAGARSGLFMEQIRIIKEMRKTDEDRGRKGTDVRPRFMVWENVPGAFSSNGGEDFRAVLEETVQIADENALIPRPANGKWRASGCILGDGFSIAWRVLDAQFWECPNVAVESRLSQILEDLPHPKYSLSAKACRGILRRAERRGKALPETLRTALELQIAAEAPEA